MCGISFIYGLKKLSGIKSQIVEMNSIIRHRGPDDEGYVFFFDQEKEPVSIGGGDTPAEVFSSSYQYTPKRGDLENDEDSILAAMGHRRLSIIDLSPAGHQPMCSRDKRLWLTYNGEIYNHIEIRKELEKSGYQFSSHSDSEVVINAYEHWGRECLHKFNGMFAFVIFDARSRSVFAARDRFGVKPLYYWISPEGSIAIASEMKQFTPLRGWKAKWNDQAVYDYLVWGHANHTSETMFKGVYQIRGGEYLEFSASSDLSKIAPQSWYTLKGIPFTGTYEDASKEYFHLLKDSISLRLRADVEVGSCLSGGLDSSSIVCLVKELIQERKAGNKQSTFSICSEHRRFDERKFIEEVVRSTQVKPHYLYPTLDSLFEQLNDIIWHQEEPFLSTSIFAQWCLFKMVKEESIKVMLDGQGADEQLGGYLGFFGNRFYDLFSTFQWLKLYKEMKEADKKHNGISPYIQLLKKLVSPRYRNMFYNLFSKAALRPNWLNVHQLEAVNKYPFSLERGQTFYDQSILQIKRSSIPTLLHYEDRNSMAHSVESRTPFLDYRLVEFTVGLPTEFKISQGWTKRVLREGMKNVLPESIRLRRDKLGFVTAEEVWLKNENPERFMKEIDVTIEASSGLVNDAIKSKMKRIINGEERFSFLPWRIVCFGKWLKSFSVGK